MSEAAHVPVRGHSTNPREEPGTIEEWQVWAETLQIDLEDKAAALARAEELLESCRILSEQRRAQVERLTAHLQGHGCAAVERD